MKSLQIHTKEILEVGGEEGWGGGAVYLLLQTRSLVLPGVEKQLDAVVVKGHDEPEVWQLWVAQTCVAEGRCVIHVFVAHITLEAS